MIVSITINGKKLNVPEGLSVRKAAQKNGIYIPGLCGHPDLKPASKVVWKKKIYRGDIEIIGDFEDEIAGENGSCGICRVKIDSIDELQKACETPVLDGMVVTTESAEITKVRRQALAKFLEHHPHACLTCAQSEGCSLTQCSSNVPENERCCILLNRCELGKIVEYVGFPEDTPKYVYEDFPKFTGDYFFNRDYNLCISCLRCVRMCNDVRGVDALSATIRDGRVWIGTTNPGLLDESYCRFCGACIEVCPTGALLDKPDSKPVRAGGHPPCIDACPAGIDIPAYVKHIAEGDFSGALEIIYDSVPFPGILGYVCFHPCEEACKRETMDEGIAICSLKRFVYENAPKDEIRSTKKLESSGKKIAVVGSGPAGLTSAYYLQKNGHQVDVFEKAEKPGGMLRYAIPGYRLPESVIEDELETLYQLGVEFKTNKSIGKDLKINDLLNDGYDAVLLTIGASLSKNLDIPGSGLDNILPAIDFLYAVRTGNPPELKGKVVVVGGGNVAIDAAMTALRAGAEKVNMVCLEQRHEMPAHTWEIQQATEEGITVTPGWGPKEFIGESGKLQTVTFKQCTRVFDSSGKFNPEYDENNIFEEKADFVIVAIGQNVDGSAIESIGELNYGAGNTIKTKSGSFATNVPGLFATGDAVRGPASVIDAIADGRKAADDIDRYLGGHGIPKVEYNDKLSADPLLGKDEKFHSVKPVKPQNLSPADRITDFSVITGSFSIDDARAEAYRCLRCNLRANITPVKLPPDKWQFLNLEAISQIPQVEGVYQLASPDKKVTKIVGSANIKTALESELDKQTGEILFCWEQDRMYSKRESELLQKHLQQYGEMPGGGSDDDLDDLF